VNGASGFPTVLLGTMFLVGVSSLIAACGAARPSAAPLSTPASHAMKRTRPSSARAVEPGSDDHPSVESEGPPPSDDDDDDDSTRTSKGPENTRNLLSR
jgi:hypothetical protein